MSYKNDLSVTIAGHTFSNPIMPASGTYDYFENNVNCFPMSELGAIMIKSVHREKRPGNPPQRIVEVTGGMLNAVGIPSVGIEEFVKNDLKKFEDIGTSVVLSIAGSQIQHYAECLEILEDNPIVHAIEMNLSCPNVGTGLAFSLDPNVLKETVEQARSKTKLPLFVKLAPNITDIRVTAKASEDAGADAITVANTWRGMLIDIDSKKPVLGNTSGGMSGPAIKPQTMYQVWQASTAVDIPIIASGGVANWRDAVEYFLAGASMVQVGSANFANPNCMVEIIDGIDDYLSANGYNSISEIIGAAH